MEEQSKERPEVLDAKELLHSNLHEVFSERDPERRRAAIERAQQERAAERSSRIEAQSSPLLTPQERVQLRALDPPTEITPPATTLKLPFTVCPAANVVCPLLAMLKISVGEEVPGKYSRFSNPVAVAVSLPTGAACHCGL